MRIPGLMVLCMLSIVGFKEITCKNTKERTVYDASKTYVHLLTHTHDDLGWLKTLDMYFSGTNETKARGSVLNILDTTIPELINDANKRFCYCEVKYFAMWWKYQTPDMKTAVKQLVNERRLEFVNGGWS